MTDDRPYQPNRNKEVYCDNCNKMTRYITSINFCTTTDCNQPIHCHRLEAHCKECGKLLDVPEIHERYKIEFSKQIADTQKSMEAFDDKMREVYDRLTLCTIC